MSKILALAQELRQIKSKKVNQFGALKKTNGHSYHLSGTDSAESDTIIAPAHQDYLSSMQAVLGYSLSKELIDVTQAIAAINANRILFPRGLNDAQRRGTGDIINFWNTQSALADERWLAYILSTAKHESAHTMQAVRETMATSEEAAIRGVTNYIFRANQTTDTANVAKVAANRAIDPSGTAYQAGTSLSPVSAGSSLSQLDSYITSQNAEIGTKNATIDTINREIDVFNRGRTSGRKTKLSKWSVNYAAIDAVTRQSYYGRGLVQLTHKGNYQEMGRILSIPDLATNPSLALDPAVSIQILFKGMVDGTFRRRPSASGGTPYKLNDFFNATTEDWTNARNIVNGIVPARAQRIGEEAQQFLLCLTNRSRAHGFAHSHQIQQREYNTGSYSEAYQTTQERFISAYSQFATDSMRTTRVPASVTLAQAALESGWGRSAPGNNFFGIKAGRNWSGRTQLLRTREVHPSSDRSYRSYPEIISIEPFVSPTDHRRDRQNRLLYSWTVRDNFRAYNTPMDSFNDHAQLFITNPRYASAMHVTNDGIQFAREVAAAGYASDPNYASSLVNIITTYNLTRFDRQ